MLERVPDAYEIASILREITHLMVYNSYFTFQGCFYKQKKGVPIGGPLAVIIAELVVRHKEREVLTGFKNDLSYILGMLMMCA